MANLLTGVVALDTYRREGVPKVLGDVEDPGQVLTRLTQTVDARDLPIRARSAWRAVQRVVREGLPATYTTIASHAQDREEVAVLLEWCQVYGMGVAYAAEPAARLLVAYAAGQERLRALQDEMARVHEESLRVFEGVV